MCPLQSEEANIIERLTVHNNAWALRMMKAGHIIYDKSFGDFFLYRLRAGHDAIEVFGPTRWRHWGPIRWWEDSQENGNLGIYTRDNWYGIQL